MEMRIVLLGFGEELLFFIKTMYGKINIVGYGITEKYSDVAVEITDFCNQKNIPVIKSHYELTDLKPDIVFMISYPPLIEESYINTYNFINMHGALVPEYRGLHGGTWAIINGERVHGYTIHKVDSGIDSGPVYHQGFVNAEMTDDVHIIRRKIFEKFAEEIEVVFLDIIEGSIQPVEQDEKKAKYVSRRKPEDGLISWNNSAENTHNLIRALTPPYTKGAFTYYKSEELFIVDSELLDYPSYIATNGQVVSNFKGRGVLVKCGDKPLLIKDVIYYDKRMNSSELFKTVGARLG